MRLFAKDSLVRPRSYKGCLPSVVWLKQVAVLAVIGFAACIAAAPAAWGQDSWELLYAFTGEAAGDNFGQSVSGAGDVNNDGYDDFIVGAAENDAGGGSAGQAYVFSGLDGDTLHIFTGEASGDRFGYSVSGAGDVNNDGYDDLIVGAPLSDAGDIEAGRAYVFSGLDGDTLHVFTGEVIGDCFGYSVSGAGDVNNDGYHDLIVGAPSACWEPPVGSGRAYVYSGQTGGLLWTFTGEAAGNRFGFSVSGAGDINDDGYDDLIVGARWTDAGRAYVYSGQNGSLLWSFTGEAAGDWLGCSVSGAGDVNNDGYDDLIVGAPGNDAGASDAGRAYVFSGLDGDTLHVFTGEAEYDELGASVSGAGNVNNDGYGDLIVGAHSSYAGGPNAGQAYVFSGLDGVTLQVLTGEAAQDWFGCSVSGAGDVNNDGYDDLIAGARGSDAAGLDAGEAYVYAGYLTRQVLMTPGPDVSGAARTDAMVKSYIQNTGTAPDTFDIHVTDSLGWNLDPVHDVIALDAGQVDSISVTVSIPDVPLGTADRIFVTAVSQANASARDSASLLVTCNAYAIQIDAVSDVGNDQGKQVKVAWSSFPGDDPLVTHFTIFRREDPLLFASSTVRPKTFSSKDYPPGDWFMVDTYPAYGETLYLAAVPTLKDSTIAEGMYWSVFFVRAGTDDPTLYYDSPVDSGYSLDNLSPSPPAGLIASHEPAATVLSWTGSDTPDFDYYTLYRDTLSGFAPDPTNRLGFTIDTVFVDSTAQLGRTYYYLVSATDFSGNESDPSNEVSGARYVTGDANGNGVVEPGDVVYLINYLFRNDPPPSPYEAGDCNCDGEVGPGDVVYLLNYLFRGWPPPTC